MDQGSIIKRKNGELDWCSSGTEELIKIRQHNKEQGNINLTVRKKIE